MSNLDNDLLKLQLNNYRKLSYDLNLVIEDLINQLIDIKGDPRDAQYPGKQEYNYELPCPIYALKAIYVYKQLKLRLPELEEPIFDCLSNGTLTMCWYNSAKKYKDSITIYFYYDKIRLNIFEKIYYWFFKFIDKQKLLIPKDKIAVLYTSDNSFIKEDLSIQTAISEMYKILNSKEFSK